MEDNNNNMEEFFKRSLERFDEAPSDDVWANVSDRLTIEAHWYDPILSLLKTAYPFLLAGLMIGIYHFYSNHKISTLKNDLSAAQSTIEILKKENNGYTGQINGIEELKENLLLKINDKNQEIEKLIQKNKQLDVSYSTLSKKSSPERERKTSKTDFTKLQRLLEDNKVLRNQLAFMNAELAALKKQNESKDLPPSMRSTEIFCSSLKHLPRVRPNKVYDKFDLHSMMKPLTLNPKIDEQIDEDLGLSKTKLQRFSFGAKAEYFNTIVQNSQWVNPGYSRGLRAEFNLSNKWAITSDLMYNNQAYTLSSGTQTFSRESLENYPGGIEDNTNINNINTRTKYFDASLGFKFMPKYDEDRLNFFVNPSVVWQLYLPQEFQFSLSQEDNIHYTEKSYTAYFGSGNLSLGVEKRLGLKMNIQISLWGEKSFIPLGFEKQYVNMFGVSSALLF